MTQTIGYCRFSPRPNADECQSNERQLERIQDYCERQGYALKANFSDRDLSGGMIKRPGLQAAIEALSPGDILVADSVDRLTRDELVTAWIKQRVLEHGATIEYADGTPSYDTAEGELACGIFALFAQYQRRKIREKTKAGLARKRASGKYLGKCPIGYRRGKEGELIEDRCEQKAIAEILQQYNLGYSPAEIAATRQRAGFTIRGKRWNERTIRRIIQRELTSKEQTNV